MVEVPLPRKAANGGSADGRADSGAGARADGGARAGRDLVTTPAAAATLGISARTLQRYAEQGLVTPAVSLPSGQYRWDVDELTAQVAAVAGSRVRTGARSGPDLDSRTGDRS